MIQDLIRVALADPDVVAAPPVLVDVGASGARHGAWRALAGASICVGFEPDARDRPRGEERIRPGATIVVPRAVVASDADGVGLYLTHEPHCSSTLPPDTDALAHWHFAPLFRVERDARVPASTLWQALTDAGLDRIDWLKLDTQGTDLRIYESLPAPVRDALGVVEMEPGVIDAYRGEDKLWAVLRAMDAERRWCADLRLGHAYRLPADRVGERRGAQLRLTCAPAPAYGEATFLPREDRLERASRRDLVVLWCFAASLGQIGFALSVADAGLRRFGDGLFDRAARACDAALAGRDPAVMLDVARRRRASWLSLVNAISSPARAVLRRVRR